jgi:N-acetyl-gamma-glutamyl-phosphate reductase
MKPAGVGITPPARVGIIGAAGYTGGELVRLLLAHPNVEIAFVQSRSQEGQKLYQTHRDLLGVTELEFTNDPSLAVDSKLDVLFLAMAHGEARKWLQETPVSESTRIIDLSHDFRAHEQSQVKTPTGHRTFVYGLPEANRAGITGAKNIANPGCFATALELALLPLARLGLLQQQSVAVTGITGSTGAGQGLSESVHFSFRANNIQAYKTLRHQHLTEVLETLNADGLKLNFVPWRGDFTRGIFATAIVEESPHGMTSELNEAKIQDIYRGFYADHPFVSISKDPIDLKSVVNTNRVQIEIVRDGSAVAIHVAIDNLLKGAAGQAVQNMNLMLGYPEDLGLKLKGVVF